jgi:NADPH:quinone reductase-like Zn-dependent oxidoreductase
VQVRLQWSGVNQSDVKSCASMQPRTAIRASLHSDGMGVIDAVEVSVPPAHRPAR